MSIRRSCSGQRNQGRPVTCARDMHALQQLALNVHIKHFDLTYMKISYQVRLGATMQKGPPATAFGPLPQTAHFSSSYAPTSSCRFSFQPVLHFWCNKCCGMCYPVCRMVHIKEPLLLIAKSSPCGSSRYTLSLSEWSITICSMPYNRK